MASTEPRSPFRTRFGVTLLAGLPGIVALVAYVYRSTPPEAVPPGLTRPLLALLSGISPLLLLAVACLVGAYAAPKAGLRSHLLDRAGAARARGSGSVPRSGSRSGSASSAACS